MSTQIHPQTMTVDGLSIRFAEGGTGPRQAMLLSPWPESIFAYEQAWPQLAKAAHIVAIDLPGFGGSERRDELMNPKAMGEFIVRIADTLGLNRPHVVAPDIGTSATLFAAAAHPDRFASLVVGTGGAAVPITLGSPLKDWVEATDLEPYRQLGGRKIVEIALDTVAGYTPSDEIREDYLNSYAGDKFAETIPYVQAYPEQLPVLGALLPGIHTPVRIVQGTEDQVVPAVNATYLGDRLPNSKVDLIDGAGHFCWEERPDDYATLVIDWWNRTSNAQ
ncbi:MULTISPECIES: alpha/beta fold hydrolase [unclassified Mycolicibacterium]|uniref:alpha/beta fold hydrolase n=1 Tax=unclassified Mycolicibacterium TaxID=2636767 RepID=UPI0012DC1A2D|nr:MULTISPECIES: alpha/beta hydrolase [unclassified Mycolicibacterium]MUL85785.1 alpha/beta hydrolase [Mycolicibacterium sp. CBMA 329]MUL90155.1 alpha/beta hydrolase [Mycolicibacterium sp. CBMA 331]MUM00924.1 alpha/beta hydrolase [Mycolicibacterium sp. CBMA 334]MUM27464.1 alpha/beta hydrolase [Mycolicibacterium sp. CBMA 295]MUM39670.1 alpha/beta hydrolase [Mycolicibacterium sp. CBMA 247]